MAEKHGISVASNRRPRRQQRLLHRYDESIVDETTGRESILDEYRTHIYYSTLDTVLEEMNQRFTEVNLSLMSAMEALLPDSEKFLDVGTLLPFLVEHYDIAEREIRVEPNPFYI